MPKFLFTGVASDGKRLTERIEAETVSAARYKLELRGWHGINFLTDELCVRTDELLQADCQGRIPENFLTPAQEAEARRSGSVWQALWFGWKMNSIFWIPLLIWNSFSYFGARPFGWLDQTGFALSAIFIAYFLWTTVPAFAYEKILENTVWHRWDQVYRWIRFVRFLKRATFVAIPELELDFREAAGLAHQGELSKALSLVAKYETHSCGQFLYYSRLAGIYENARDYAKMTELRRMAAENGSGKPEEKLDLALGLLRRHRKVEEARQILEEVDLSSSGELVAIFHAFCSGLLHIELGAWKKSDEVLQLATDAVRPYSTNQLMVGMLQEIRAFHCIALANLGKKSEAADLLRQAKPILSAQGELELLDRCHAALGNPV
jgi:tetratricopeptide (TPR) repeat protein